MSKADDSEIPELELSADLIAVFTKPKLMAVFNEVVEEKARAAEARMPPVPKPISQLRNPQHGLLLRWRRRTSILVAVLLVITSLDLAIERMSLYLAIPFFLIIGSVALACVLLAEVGTAPISVDS